MGVKVSEKDVSKDVLYLNNVRCVHFSDHPDQFKREFQYFYLQQDFNTTLLYRYLCFRVNKEVFSVTAMTVSAGIHSVML